MHYSVYMQLPASYTSYMMYIHVLVTKMHYGTAFSLLLQGVKAGVTLACGGPCSPFVVNAGRNTPGEGVRR